MADLLLVCDKATLTEFTLPEMTLLSSMWLLLIVALGLVSGLFIAENSFSSTVYVDIIRQCNIGTIFVGVSRLLFPMLLK